MDASAQGRGRSPASKPKSAWRGSKSGARPDGKGASSGEPRITNSDNPGWTIFSYLLGGMAVYGGIGWLIGRWAGHQPIFLAVGMVIGLALAITLTILRYGRS